jgi:hypothetical protein
LIIEDLGSASFFSTGPEGTWPPQLAFDLNSAALHTLIPTLHHAHIPVILLFFCFFSSKPKINICFTLSYTQKKETANYCLSSLLL